MKTIRILIADDHEVVCTGARALLEREPGWEVCGFAKTGREAVEQAQRLKPDIVILDMGMPDLNGLEAARQIKRRLPETEVLMFTAQESDEVIRDVFEAGVKSYILKSEAVMLLVDAVRSLCQHKPFFTSQVSEVLFARFMNRSGGKTEVPEKNERLTAREREIVQLVAEGKSNKDVAAALGISVKTAETHRASILRKLKLDSLPALVRYAIRNKIIEA